MLPAVFLRKLSKGQDQGQTVEWTGGCGFVCGAETGNVQGGRAGEMGVQGSSLETGGGIVLFDGYCLLLL